MSTVLSKGKPMKPNIVYIHAHDLGRFCEPFGYNIPAPNLMRFAGQGTLFRQCHCHAPSCAPSRAALVTGEYPHVCGMLGLPAEHLGYKLNDYSHHINAFLKDNGYETALSGVQHVARAPFADPENDLGYDRFLNHEDIGNNIYRHTTTTGAALDYLREEHDKPFFLSVGFVDPHRSNKFDKATFTVSQNNHQPADIDRLARFCRPWPHMPDTPVTRREMANFKIGVELMDSDVGRILKVLDEPAFRENTLVIFTTDHGPGVCEMKCTLSDRGTGVTTIFRGPDGKDFKGSEFNTGKVFDALVQHMDFFPTIADIIGAEPPGWLAGTSLLPLATGEKEQIHDVIFSEQTYHWGASPRPLRAVRTDRYKYIRSFKPDQPRGVDTGPAETFWNEYGYNKRPFEDEMLYDLYFDPNEAHNCAQDPEYADILKKMQDHLDTWMKDTNDPLLDGIPRPPAALGK